MDDNKFTPITANLLVRKGEAAPSSVTVVASRRRANRPRAAADNVVQMNGLVPPDGIFNKTALEKARQKPHKIMVVLTELEHETLGHIAAKKGLTRHQIVRNALGGYFEWLIDEYGTSCRCIATACSAECDHLNAAEDAELSARGCQTD
jgi:hypothetical protein